MEGEAGGGLWVGFGEAVGEGVGGGGIDDAAKEARADAADAEAGGLLAGEYEGFDGAVGLEAGFFEGAHGFEAAEDSDGAVVHAGVGDGVGVGAGADGGEGGVGAGEAEEGVADGVCTHSESGRFSEGLDVGAGFEVAGGEDDAGDGGGGRGKGCVGGGWAVGEGGEVVELAEETGDVDVEGRHGGSGGGKALLDASFWLLAKGKGNNKCKCRVLRFASG